MTYLTHFVYTHTFFWILHTLIVTALGQQLASHTLIYTHLLSLFRSATYLTHFDLHTHFFLDFSHTRCHCFRPMTCLAHFDLHTHFFLDFLHTYCHCFRPATYLAHFVYTHTLLTYWIFYTLVVTV